jgi:signal transduction histidine kinase
MESLRLGILWKFLAIILVVVSAVILVIWFTIDTLAASYFSSLMEEYNIAPAETHAMFLDAVHRYLVQASLVALAFCIFFAFLLTRRILRPISRMAEVTRRLAEGDYSARVEVESQDEVGELAIAFNRMADSLERIEKLRKTMVIDVSHELRTPLTNIRGYLEAIADGVVPADKETYDLLQREIMRLVRLVEDLTRLAKAEAGYLEMTRGSVDLKEIIEEVCALEGPQLEARALRLSISMPSGPKVVLGDRDKILQILHNILQNARRYSRKGSEVLLAVERRGELIRIEVTNEGDGIAGEDLPFIFERFYRGDKSRSRRSGGAGIGLAIVKELVEAHGGKVGAESDNGRTKIWFSLPKPSSLATA